MLLVEGGAHLLIEGEGELVLGPGDHLLIAGACPPPRDMDRSRAADDLAGGALSALSAG